MTMKAKCVLICGGSGMVGREILSLCLEDQSINKIHLLLRKPLAIQSEKIETHILANFSQHDPKASYLKNIDAVFFCIGVYTGTVSRSVFQEVTVTYPLALAKALKTQQSKARFVLLSGAGADPTEQSKMMFARDKGIAENRIRDLQLKGFHSFRPAYIYPVKKRKEPQFAYKMARFLYPLLKWFGKKYSIPSTLLAKAMFKVGHDGHSQDIIENEKIWEIVSH